MLYSFAKNPTGMGLRKILLCRAILCDLGKEGRIAAKISDFSLFPNFV